MLSSCSPSLSAQPTSATQESPSGPAAPAAGSLVALHRVEPFWPDILAVVPARETPLLLLDGQVAAPAQDTLLR